MFEGALWKQANISGLWELHSGWNFQKAFFQSLKTLGNVIREFNLANINELRCPITFGEPVNLWWSLAWDFLGNLGEVSKWTSKKNNRGSLWFCQNSYWTLPSRNSGCFHQQLWFSIVFCGFTRSGNDQRPRHTPLPRQVSRTVEIQNLKRWTWQNWNRLWTVDICGKYLDILMEVINLDTWWWYISSWHFWKNIPVQEHS